MPSRDEEIPEYVTIVGENIDENLDRCYEQQDNDLFRKTFCSFFYSEGPLHKPVWTKKGLLQLVNMVFYNLYNDAIKTQNSFYKTTTSKQYDLLKIYYAGPITLVNYYISFERAQFARRMMVYHVFTLLGADRTTLKISHGVLMDY